MRSLSSLFITNSDDAEGEWEFAWNIICDREGKVDIGFHCQYGRFCPSGAKRGIETL